MTALPVLVFLRLVLPRRVHSRLVLLMFVHPRFVYACSWLFLPRFVLDMPILGLSFLCVSILGLSYACPWLFLPMHVHPWLVLPGFVLDKTRRHAETFKNRN